MNKFVKDQKVVCVDNGLNKSITSGKVYKICEGVAGYCISIVNDFNRISNYHHTFFETIIQGVDDIIPGMAVSYNDEKWFVYKCDTDGLLGVQMQGSTYNGTIFIKDLDEYKPKQEDNMCIKDLDFEIVKQFNIRDIYKNKPNQCIKWQEEFLELLEEGYHSSLFFEKHHILTSKILRRNLDWLEEKGFVKIKRDTKLNVGMKFKCYNTFQPNNNIYTWCSVGNHSYNMISGDYTCFYHTPKSNINTLEELNSGTVVWEVVSE